jgi:hypothetical protein
MAKSMGYLLPAGEAYTEEVACMMLFYPDEPEYRRALFGALDYLGTWLAWERDSEKKGKDAARAWSEAVALTRECIEMNTCETILSLLTEIRDNTGVYCCDVVDVSDGDRYTDEVEDGVGDVPQNIIDAGYATGVSDWAGFDEYKCMISHLMIQNMQSQTAKFLSWFDGTEAILITVAAVAAVALAIFTAGGAVLAYGIALSVAGVAGLYAAATLLGEVGLSSLVDNLGDHYDDLVCAVYASDGSVGAVVALKDAIDEHFNAAEAVYLKSLNLAPQLKALYAGRYDAQDIAEKMADEGYDVGDYDCSCPPAESSYLATFDTDTEEWNAHPSDSYWENNGNPAGGIYMHWALGSIDLHVNDIQIGAGVSQGDDIEIVQVSLDLYRPNAISPDGAMVTFDPSDADIDVIEDGVVQSVWTQLDFVPASPVLCSYNVPALVIVLDGGTGSSGKVDNVRVWFNTV